MPAYNYIYFQHSNLPYAVVSVVQVKDIFQTLPNRDLQAITVSATLPPDVLAVSHEYNYTCMV